MHLLKARFCGRILIGFLCVALIGSAARVCAGDELAEFIEEAKDVSREVELRLHALDEIDMLRIRGDKLTGTIGVLQSLLKDPSVPVRIKSAQVLFDLEEPVEKLLPVALDGLRHEESETREDACYLLWDFGYRAAPAIDSIVLALSDDDPSVRSLAAILLGEIGPDHKQTSIPTLIRSLEDSDLGVRVSVAEALTRVDGPIGDAINVLVEAVRQSSLSGDDYSPMSDEYGFAQRIGDLGGDGEPAVSVLNETLMRGGSYRQTSSSKALGEIGVGLGPALEGLALALRNGEVKGMPFVHRSWCASDEAAKALAAMGIDAAPTLISALSDPDERVRANAAQALGKIPAASNDSVAKLAECMSDQDPAVRSHAAWALGRLARTRLGHETITKNLDDIIGQLVQLLFEDTEWSSSPGMSGITQSYSVPWHAVEAIKRIQPDHVTLIDAIRFTLQEKKTINHAVAQSIADIGSEATSLTPLLLPMLSDVTYRSPAAFAIASIAPDTPELKLALESALIKSKTDWPDLAEDRDIDRVAARGLAKMGSRASSSIPRLKEAVDVATNSRYVGNCGKIIVCSLAVLQIDPEDQDVPNALLEALDTSHGAFDENAITAAEEAIPDLLSKQDLLRSLVIERLSDPDVEIRLRSATYLTEAGIAPQKTINTLEGIARNGRNHMREEAVGQLVHHGPAAKHLIDLLTEFLSDDEVFHVGGDFYGNGGTPRTVREQAIAALAAIGQDSVPALTKSLNDPHHLVRAGAATSLGLMGAEGRQATERLVQLTRDKSHFVRHASVVALGKIWTDRPTGDENVLQALRRSRDDARHAVRQASHVALERLQTSTK